MGTSTPERTKARPGFSERLYVTWWVWPLPLVGATLLAAEIHMGYPGLRGWLPYAVLLPLTAVLLVGMGRLSVRVTEGEEPELWVGDAHLPLRFAGDVEVIGKQDKRKALGPELDPAAFVAHRGWVPSLVRIRLTDPEDPTPYWLVSTRRPERLAALVRDAAPGRPAEHEDGRDSRDSGDPSKGDQP
ncbi:Protein of unknown function [Prauserella marina]|uniref:Uncharacterized protein n=1 Tax=Prauserella marina TaxID=530584 RepID=A0A1G6J832_9PSEU|nr:DUF3093 domain-containing protein [Prauserella marina]PWV84715.1 hypothetical protein DES30_101733 [Prauserella marina]SDC15014.1 Protein of unknown function [Prauserella marina]